MRTKGQKRQHLIMLKRFTEEIITFETHRKALGTGTQKQKPSPAHTLVPATITGAGGLPQARYSPVPAFTSRSRRLTSETLLHDSPFHWDEFSFFMSPSRPTLFRSHLTRSSPPTRPPASERPTVRQGTKGSRGSAVCACNE